MSDTSARVCPTCKGEGFVKSQQGSLLVGLLCPECKGDALGIGRRTVPARPHDGLGSLYEHFEAEGIL
jgi:DnaJ-class molecular chaperone